MDKNLLEVRHLSKHYAKGNLLFPGKVKTLNRAVDDVSFNLKKGETLGIVGESGAGKSTLASMILKLTEPTRGSIFFDGIDLLNIDKKKMRHLRKRIQIIFQDPYSSLDPRMKIWKTITEPLWCKKKSELKEKACRLLEKVGLRSASIYKYPHQFSGGERQRIGIARALCTEPDLIIADEPVSALDVSIQAQILNLLYDLKKELNMACIFISHDLRAVGHISDTIAVMHNGKIVETSPASVFFDSPVHSLSKKLLNAALQ